MNITTIRNGLKQRLDVVSGLSAFARMPGNIDPPAAIIYPGTPLYSVESMGRGGAARINLRVDLYAQIGSDWDNAQQTLDGFLSSTAGDEATSVVDALVSTATVTDATLGGTLFVSTVGDPYELVQYGGENAPTYLSATINCYLAQLRT